LGSCPTDATREGRCRRAVLNSPLCQHPNVCVSNHRGILEVGLGRDPHGLVFARAPYAVLASDGLARLIDCRSTNAAWVQVRASSSSCLSSSVLASQAESIASLAYCQNRSVIDMATLRCAPSQYPHALLGSGRLIKIAHLDCRSTPKWTIVKF
jgi:hypothetical protein